jgi:hypothetical protein
LLEVPVLAVAFLQERDRHVRASGPLSPQRLEVSLKREPKFKIRNLGRDKQGNLIVESQHFRVVHDQEPKLMERVAERAEALRLKVHRGWFDDSPYEWDGKCGIYLYANYREYLRLTKQKGAAAHFNASTEGAFVSRRSVHLPCGLPGLFEDLLPHEITHSVMANRFNGRAPRWADEGMAALSESPASHEKRRKRLALARKQDDLFAVEVLMQTKDARHIGCLEYYAQSASLVEFFVAEKGRKPFTRFLWDALRTNYEAALKQHYGIQGFADLSRRWLAYAFGPRGKVHPPQLPPSSLRLALAEANGLQSNAHPPALATGVAEGEGLAPRNGRWTGRWLKAETGWAVRK